MTGVDAVFGPRLKDASPTEFRGVPSTVLSRDSRTGSPRCEAAEIRIYSNSVESCIETKKRKEDERNEGADVADTS